MSNEPHTPDPDGARDTRVSQAYSDLAIERAPDKLNAAVLRDAAKAARPPYKRSVLWTRPVAWAAVVAICLAITLQVTQVPVPSDMAGLADLQRDDPAASPDSSPAATTTRQQTEAVEIAPEQPARDMPAARRDEERAEAKSLAIEQDRPAAAPALTTLEEIAAPAPTAREETAAPLPEDFEMQDADMLRRAEDMVRQREGDNKVSEHSARGAAGFAPASVAASVEFASCTDEERQDPQAWLACIVLLERGGLADEAALEREQLHAAFPDFEVPANTE